MIKEVDRLPERSLEDGRIGEATKVVAEFRRSGIKLAEVTLRSYDTFDSAYHALVSATRKPGAIGTVRVIKRSGRLYLERV